jgi:hypothetical protein
MCSVPARVVVSASQAGVGAVPALAPTGFSKNVNVTSVGTEQLPFVSVHLRVYVPK